MFDSELLLLKLRCPPSKPRPSSNKYEMRLYRFSRLCKRKVPLQSVAQVTLRRHLRPGLPPRGLCRTRSAGAPPKHFFESQRPALCNRP